MAGALPGKLLSVVIAGRRLRCQTDGTLNITANTSEDDPCKVDVGVTVAAGGWITRTVDSRDWTISMSAKAFNDALAVANVLIGDNSFISKAMVDGNLTVVVDFMTNAGAHDFPQDLIYHGIGVITNFTLNAPVSGSATYDLEITGNGPVTYTTVGATVVPPVDPPVASDLIAFYDFSESAAPYKSKATFGDLPLAIGAGAPAKVADATAPFNGGAISFNGSSYLILPAANVGEINISNHGNAVTVIAWVKRGNNSAGFIAGMWQEDNTNPKRQYALFLDLDKYGGDDRVCGHVSKTGGVTPGYPFSRDYSASRRMLGSNAEWRCIAFTYDGAQIISYLDAIMDSFPTYTDDQSQTYSKNPYVFTDGLNSSNVSDFTVGSCKLTAGFSNFFTGQISGIKVYRKALSQAEIMAEHVAVKGTRPLLIFDFWTSGFYADGTLSSAAIDWKAVKGPSATDVTANSATGSMILTKSGTYKMLFRSGSGDATNTNTASVGYFERPMTLLLSQLSLITFKLNNVNTTDAVRVCLKVDGTWYASSALFVHTVGGGALTNWTGAELKSFTPSRTAGTWQALTMVMGSTLSLGAVINAVIPDGQITGIGFYNPLATGILRIDDLLVY